MSLYGGIEAGGTKFICIVASAPDQILVKERFITLAPVETLNQVISFYRQQISKYGPLKGFGIGSFGPVDLNPLSPFYGAITSTPKLIWQNTPLLRIIEKEFNVPVAMDTDVNAAAVGEGKWGAGQGLDNFIYVTIGTGIGAGVVVNGEPVHGLIHPEVGHIRLPHDWQKDSYVGACPFHGDCWEGLASGTAMNQRWGIPAEQLPNDHPAWDLEAEYIAEAIHNMVCSFSPQRIILGGGVMQQEKLFSLVRNKVLQSLNGYVQSPIILEHIETYIVPPGLGSEAGVLGALALAMQAE